MYSYFITDLFLGVDVTTAYQLYYSQYLFSFRFAYKTYSRSWTFIPWASIRASKNQILKNLYTIWYVECRYAQTKLECW